MALGYGNMFSINSSKPGSEFFNFWALSAVLVFVLNNFYLKHAFGNFFTGKLSDLSFCFFFPLYCSVILSYLTKLTRKTRILIGAGLTWMSLIAVKTSDFYSTLLNQALSPASRLLGFGDSINLVDQTDLIALPMSLLACYLFIRPGYKNEL